jgi:hypothetical protein
MSGGSRKRRSIISHSPSAKKPYCNHLPLFYYHFVIQILRFAFNPILRAKKTKIAARRVVPHCPALPYLCTRFGEQQAASNMKLSFHPPLSALSIWQLGKNNFDC